MPEETEVVAAKETPAPPTETVEKPEPKSPRERLEAIYDEHSKADAEEAAAGDESRVDGEPQAPQAGDEKKPDEAAPQVKPEKLEATTEQLKDKAWWGALSKEDRVRAARDYPVESAHVNASQAAGTKIVNEARAEAERILNEARTKAAPSKEERHDAPTDEELSELSEEELTQQLGSLDPADLLKAVTKIADARAMRILRESGIDPARNKAQAVLGEAVNAAIAELPDIGNFKLTELDAVAEESPALKKLAESGDPESIKIALVEAGRILIGRKKAAADAAKAAADKAEADRKKKETQKIVQSSAHLASADVLKPHGGSPDTRTQRERLNAAADREIARQNAIGAK